MSETPAPAARHRPRHGRGSHRRSTRSPLSPLTVLGEVLLLGGLAVVGYLVWQPWHTGVVVTGKQVELSAETSAAWRAAAESEEPAQTGSTTEPVVTAVVAPAEVFGVLYVPAFSPTYANRMAETTDWWTVLNLDDKGIGRYETTQMPGEPGNFAVAGHRSGPLINSFKEVMDLRVGDPLYVETAQGWYTYRFRSFEYVWPTEVDVLNPFPRLSGVPGTDQILTLTTCHPKDSGDAERAIAYAVFESFRPLSAGPPAELVKVNTNVKAAAS